MAVTFVVILWRHKTQWKIVLLIKCVLLPGQDFHLSQLHMPHNFTFHWFTMNFNTEYGQMKTIKNCRQQIWENYLIISEVICLISKPIFCMVLHFSNVLLAQNTSLRNILQIEKNLSFKCWMIHPSFIKSQSFRMNSINIRIWSVTSLKLLQMINKESLKLNDFYLSFIRFIAWRIVKIK